VLLIEGVGLIVLLQIATAGITARGAPVVLSTSVWLVLLFLAYVGVMYLVYRHRGQPRWTPTATDDVPQERSDDAPVERDDEQRPPMRKVWLASGALSLAVLLAGYLATETAEALARQTGLGSAFLGATLLAAATSLPELSTTTAAARNGRYTMAISNVFGSNAFDVALIFLAELLHRGGSVLERPPGTLVFIATIATIMTCIYLWGLMERENRTVWRIGWDSAAVVVVYFSGMAVLYVIQ
jgi:cation:H+ antiporter